MLATTVAVVLWLRVMATPEWLVALIAPWCTWCSCLHVFVASVYTSDYDQLDQLSRIAKSEPHHTITADEMLLNALCFR